MLAGLLVSRKAKSRSHDGVSTVAAVAAVRISSDEHCRPDDFREVT
jgi:hypothetical protein